jgi:putative ATPase
VISASEDIGNADPRALQVAVAASQALDYVGLPEAQYALAQATIFLAVSPKSDTVGRAFAGAMGDVLTHGALPVPNHLRNAADRRMKQHGIGVGYKNPHDFEGDDVAQQYLPDAIADHRYFVAGDQGHELQIASRQADRDAARAAGARRKPTRPGADPMGIFGAAMKAAGESRAKLAKTQKADAGE